LLLTILLSFLPLALTLTPQAQSRAIPVVDDIISDLLGNSGQLGLDGSDEVLGQLQGLQAKANQGLLDLCDADVSL
jgi:hypothetical protein